MGSRIAIRLPIGLPIGVNRVLISIPHNVGLLCFDFWSTEDDYYVDSTVHMTSSLYGQSYTISGQWDSLPSKSSTAKRGSVSLCKASDRSIQQERGKDY
jgi:hypothetical protein